MIDTEPLMMVLWDYQSGHAADESDMARSLRMPVDHYLALLHGKRQANEEEKSSICSALKLTPETITSAVPPRHMLSKEVEFSFVARMWIKSIMIHATRIEYAEFHNKGLTTTRMRDEAAHDLGLLGLTEREVNDCLFIFSDEDPPALRVNKITYRRALNVRVNIGNHTLFANGKPKLDALVSMLVFRFLYLGYSAMLSESRYGEIPDRNICLIEAYGIYDKP